MFVRCLKLNLNRKFGEELTNYVKSLLLADCLILDIINWIIENIHRFTAKTPESANSTKSSTDGSNGGAIKFARMWIYCHHIYSLDKRKDICNWAKELNLRGFSKPGKPGIICVEGEQTSVQQFWQRLRALNWQRIQVKETETFEVDATSLKEVAKFDTFEEKIFVANDTENNFDFAQMFIFLKEKGLSQIFTLYFGITGDS